MAGTVARAGVGPRRPVSAAAAASPGMTDGQITSIVYKIVVIGDSNVGKTCLLTRFVKDDFSDIAVPTIGVDSRWRDCHSAAPPPLHRD